MKNRFIYNFKNNHCILVDKDNDIICTFTKHKFNDTQEYSVPEEKLIGLSVSEMAKIMDETLEYLKENHSNVIH